MNADKASEARKFLHALKEEGIEEIYLPPKSKKRAVTPPPVPGPVTFAEKAPRPAGNIKEEIQKLREQAAVCPLCTELVKTRNKVVFGSGNIKARLMFVGEAPGKDEDEQGLPFVGAAGQLLTKIIESIGLSREEVFIANTLKCRPPGNRQPQPQELENCRPYLQRQIELIGPEIICALGSFAAREVLKTEEPISKLRGRFINSPYGVKVMSTFHPAYLLRNPGEKRKVWEDMKMIRKELDRLASENAS